MWGSWCVLDSLSLKEQGNHWGVMLLMDANDNDNGDGDDGGRWWEMATISDAATLDPRLCSAGEPRPPRTDMTLSSVNLACCQTNLLLPWGSCSGGRSHTIFPLPFLSFSLSFAASASFVLGGRLRCVWVGKRGASFACLPPSDPPRAGACK